MYDEDDNFSWGWSDERREIIEAHKYQFREFLRAKRMYDAYVDEENEMHEDEKIELQDEYIKEWRYSLESDESLYGGSLR